MSNPYEEILYLPHHVSARHPQMPLADRAAQFAPFAALTGYGDAIKETGRLTDRVVELDEYEKAVLNERLTILQARIKTRPIAQFTCFIPDKRKLGGAYADIIGAVKRVDTTAQAVILTDGTKLPFTDIVAIDTECEPMDVESSGMESESSYTERN